MLLSVIIPCYNEEQTIQLILDQVRAVKLDKEIIVVDDCSSDRTPMILQGIGPYLQLLHRHTRVAGEDRA